MASHGYMKKRRLYGNDRNEEDSGSSEKLEGSDNEDINFLNEDVEVEFEARTPEARDEYGIKRLLHQLFLKANVDITDLTNLILEQNYIGSVIQQSDMAQDSDDDEDDDIFGFISVINITEKKHRESVKQLRHLLLQKCREDSDDNLVTQFQSLLDGESHIGFIFSERFINIPPKIAVPSYESLRKDIEAAIQKKMKFNFDRYFLISKIYKPLKSRNSNNGINGVIYSNAEEEFLENEADLSFDYSVRQEKDAALGGLWDGDDDVSMEPYRRLLVFNADRLSSFIEKMKSNFS